MEKLVRDRIPIILEENGEWAQFHAASDSEFLQRLLDKLIEEVHEFIKDESIEELADILDIIETLSTVKGFSTEQIERARHLKYKRCGSFKNRLIIHMDTKKSIVQN